GLHCRADQQVRSAPDKCTLVALAAPTLRLPDESTGALEPIEHCARDDVRRTCRQRQILLTQAIEAREAAERRGHATLARGAAVGRAGVAVVAHERRAGLTDAALAQLVAVAGVHVRAGRAVRRRDVLAAEHRIAAVGGAGIAVVAGVGSEHT